MKEAEIKPIRERVLSNKKLGKLVNKYAFNISQTERGLFLSLIEESYNIALEDVEEKINILDNTLSKLLHKPDKKKTFKETLAEMKVILQILREKKVKK